MLTALHGLTYAELIKGKGTDVAAAYASGSMWPSTGFGN
jgi:hypothetical protein